MAPLGLFMTTMGALGGPTGMMGDLKGPIRAQNWFECAGAGELQPLELSYYGGIDSNDMWDYADAAGNYMPQDASTHFDEGFWERDISVGYPADIQPIAGACS